MSTRRCRCRTTHFSCKSRKVPYEVWQRLRQLLELCTWLSAITETSSPASRPSVSRFPQQASTSRNRQSSHLTAPMSKQLPENAVERSPGCNDYSFECKKVNCLLMKQWPTQNAYLANSRTCRPASQMPFPKPSKTVPGITNRKNFRLNHLQKAYLSQLIWNRHLRPKGRDSEWSLRLPCNCVLRYGATRRRSAAAQESSSCEQR